MLVRNVGKNFIVNKFLTVIYKLMRLEKMARISLSNVTYVIIKLQLTTE